MGSVSTWGEKEAMNKECDSRRLRCIDSAKEQIMITTSAFIYEEKESLVRNYTSSLRLK